MYRTLVGPSVRVRVLVDRITSHTFQNYCCNSEALYAGESIVVAFNASGDAVYGPYDIDLFKGNNEVRGCTDRSEVEAFRKTATAESQ